MATLNKKIKLYLEANSKVYVDEKLNYIIRNEGDGNGDYLHSWNVDGLAEPTAEQIASYETAGNNAEALQVILNKRKTEYKDFGHQLDLLYHDMTAGKLDGTGEWHKHIKAVKDANSKE
jgi:hypothetical protein